MLVLGFLFWSVRENVVFWNILFVGDVNQWLAIYVSYSGISFKLVYIFL